MILNIQKVEAGQSVHIRNPSIWETEVGGLGAQGQSQIHGQTGLHENCKYSSTDKAITKM